MKIILIYSIFLISSVNMFAQARFGVKAGANLANVTNIVGDDPTFELATNSKPIFIYHYGITAEVDMGEKLALRTDLLLNAKGDSNEFFSVSGSPTNFQYVYLSVPIAVKYKIGKLGILGGLETSVLVNSSIKSPGSPRFNLRDSPLQPKRLDLGALVGLDYQINKFLVEARYVHGLTPFSKLNFTDENGNPLSGLEQYNAVFQLSLSYFFLGM